MAPIRLHREAATQFFRDQESHIILPLLHTQLVPVKAQHLLSVSHVISTRVLSNLEDSSILPQISVARDLRDKLGLPLWLAAKYTAAVFLLHLRFQVRVSAFSYAHGDDLLLVWVAHFRQFGIHCSPFRDPNICKHFITVRVAMLALKIATLEYTQTASSNSNNTRSYILIVSIGCSC